ncbi:hypothetical protein NQ318_017696 [Aromia moschata]|uniref:Uncharacterized protein n=1 Tax=Aromia moschata TaxID=1265417 RepID=A0AAV8Y2H4_9CUCU|nr:hypothetical protein NQ318_017696 [Aromia moschata]
MNSKTVVSRQFPLLDKEVLNKTPIVNKGSIPRASALKKGLSFSRPPIGPNDKSLKPSNHQDMSPALIAQANWTFVEKLLKDCKTKTKRMLLAKLGAEGVTLSSNNASDSFGAVEESTLVASLCDFLEKDEVSRLALNLENWTSQVSDIKLKTELPDLPSSLLFDMTNIQAMPDVKTGIGMARAWVRLALEKKQLSKHFRTLLSDQGLLRGQYKRSAFLRCEEEREQFFYHLLSLNAVDYFCFTSTYPTTVIPYRIVIVPNKKGTTSSADVWIVLSGTLLETNRIAVPKATLNFECRHQNLGVLTTLRIGHDNSGLYAKWMVDIIIVRNEITWPHLQIPLWSLVRQRLGTLFSKKEEVEESVKSCGSLGRSTPRARSPAPPGRPELKPSQIQHMLGDCVNKIVKWHYRRSSERHTTLTALLCSENGLVFCLENVFLLGFKSARLFMGKHYLWDYFVRAKEQFELELVEEASGNRTASLERNHQETVAVWRCYCHLIDEMTHTSKTLGKDGKFQLFICLSVREHLLHRMLVPMAACKVTQEMYEENSFLRNRGLLTFLRQILLPLDDLDVVLEKSVSHGISSPSPHS